nr:zinc finger, CCHC-type [Tanacetum cinerariifolium]
MNGNHLDVNYANDGFQTLTKKKNKGKYRSTKGGMSDGQLVKQNPLKAIVPFSSSRRCPNVDARGNITVSNCYAALDDESEEEVKNVNDESANLFNSTKIGGSSSTFASTLIDTSKKLMPNNGQAVSQLEYFRVIGCLMYAMICTRPDIAFAVGKLSRYSNPGTQHWQAIQRALKYLKKTMDYSLTYTGYPSVLEGYTDAS